MSVGCQTKIFSASACGVKKKARTKQKTNKFMWTSAQLPPPRQTKGKAFCEWEKKQWEVKVKENHHIIAISGVGLVAAANTSHAENPNLHIHKEKQTQTKQVQAQAHTHSFAEER